MRSAFGLEDILDAATEQAGDGETEPETRIGPAALDGVHGLSRDAKPLGQRPLGPAPFEPEFPQRVSHGDRLEPMKGSVKTTLQQR